MRIIEKKAVSAFYAGRDFSLSNTSVVVSGGLVRFYLHGNLIAFRDLAGGPVSYSCGGWHSRTTSSRLRALGAPVHIKNGRIIYDNSGAEVLYRFGYSFA